MATNSSFLAFSFVTPAFFAAGILLAAIPILIHILNRRRYKTVQWAAMEFLLRAMRKNRRRLKFEQWLLLATRCLVLFIVATALARPMGCRDSTLASIAGEHAGLHVFVIDNSYSMAYEADRPGAKTHLDRAKAIVKEAIDRLQSGGESVAIVTASRPAAAMLAAPTYDLESAKGIVDRIPQSYNATDVLGALRIVKDIASRDRGRTSRNLYLLTDATRSAWETADAGAIKQAAQELSKEFRIAHFNLGKPGQWNQAALAVKPQGNLVTNKFSTYITATLQLFGGAGGAGDPMVQWKLDDALLPGGHTIRLASGTAQNDTQSAAVFRTGGAHVISAGLIGDDRLKVDDARWRVLDVTSQMKVLIVEGERGMNRLAGSGSLLSLALAPPRENAAPGGAQSGSYVAPELASDLELGNKVLTDYRAVILAGVGQLQPAQADQLALFVKQGGALIIFMGEPVVAENYNSVLLPRHLLPGPLTKRVSASGDQSPFLFDFKPRGTVLHPMLKAFENQENSGLDTAEIYTYWQMDVKPDAHAERVLNYLSKDGKGPPDPAITVHPLGRGRVVVFTTTANAEWTSFPAKPNYVTLMHELLAGSVSSRDAWLNLTTDDPLLIPSNVKLTATPQLVDPAQKEIPLDPVPAGGAASFRSPPLKQPGVYHLNTGSSTIPVAVNVPAEEADVRTLDNGAIKSALGGIDVDLEGDALPAPAASAGAVAGSDFGWPLMLAGLLLVGSECFLAMRFGHYRR
jgi:Mg-chelatase subunit ChlD